VVGGEASIDGWKVAKNDLYIFDKRMGDKAKKIIRNPGGGTLFVDVPIEDRNRFCLDDETARKIAHQALLIERHYRKLLNRPTLFMDLEIVVEKGEPIFVQARPETIWSNRVGKPNALVVVSRSFDKQEEGTAKLIFQGGFGASAGVAVGPLIIARTLEEAKVRFAGKDAQGGILVTTKTAPEWVPVAMGKAGAFVTDIGGAFNHAAVVGRELGKPVIVDTRDAVSRLARYDGKIVSINAGSARIYEGRLDIVERIDHYDLSKSEDFKPQTKKIKYDREFSGQHLVTKPRHPLRNLQKALYLKALELVKAQFAWKYDLIDIKDDQGQGMFVTARARHLAFEGVEKKTFVMDLG